MYTTRDWRVNACRPEILAGPVAPIDQRRSIDLRVGEDRARARQCVFVCVCTVTSRVLQRSSFSAGPCVRDVCTYRSVCVCGERARVVRFDPHDCVRLVRGGVSAAILASRDSSAAAVARPTQTPPRRRSPAPSVPPRTGPVGGASSRVFASSSSAVGYPFSPFQKTSARTPPSRPKIGGGGGCWFSRRWVPVAAVRTIAASAFRGGRRRSERSRGERATSLPKPSAEFAAVVVLVCAAAFSPSANII